MIRSLTVGFMLFACVLCRAHDFIGTHFLASYCDCNLDRLTDLKELEIVMIEASNSSGATVLDSLHYIFEPDAMTLVILLSESHASIHTYPEYSSCFVDLFTCGDSCDYRNFHAVLMDYLQPDSISTHVFLRGN